MIASELKLPHLAHPTTVAERGCAAWEWLDARMDRFTPWRGDGELSLEGVQAIAELSILFVRLTDRTRVWDQVCRKPGFEERWRRHLVEQLSQPAVAELPRKRPVQAFPYILPYLVLRSSGWRHPFYERTLELLLKWGFPDAEEVVPFRALDVAYFFNKAGYGDRRDIKPLYERTFLSRMSNLVYISDEAAYSITHTILYLSDFGNEVPAMPEEQLSRVRAIVESLIVHYWRLRHWDLLGELLLCASIVGSPERSLAPHALQAFLAAHHEDGSVAGRGDLTPELVEARRKGDESRIFSACYHTTVVSLLLATQLLEQGLRA